MKKALILIDIQDTFILNRNKYILSNIEKYIDSTDYDLYISTIQYNTTDSMWVKQGGWNDLIGVKENAYFEKKLKNKNHKIIYKLGRSAFKGDESLDCILKENNIEEIHLVGFESNDCVFATAHEGFDLGYFTYVIKECVETGSTAKNHEYAMKLLEYVNLVK